MISAPTRRQQSGDKEATKTTQGKAADHSPLSLPVNDETFSKVK